MRLATVLLGCVWCAAVAWYGWSTLPQLPLDVSASDPATLDALNSARVMHGATFAAIAVVPATVLVWLGGRLTRKT
jgi:hypothetical protein